MGYIVTIFLYLLTNWGLKWDEIGTHADDRTVFIPFDEKGLPVNSEHNTGKTDHHPNDVDDFGDY